MVNKRGTEISNSLITVVIAIVCLAVLGYAVIKLYSNLRNQETANAQKTLDGLVEKINSLKDGENTQMSPAGLGSKWFITGWSADDVGRPAKCYLGGCVCICKGILNEKKATVCQESGVCKIIKDKNVKVVEKGTVLEIGSNCVKNDQGRPDIRLTSNLVSLEISSNNGQIEVARVFSEAECKYLKGKLDEINSGMLFR